MPIKWKDRGNLKPDTILKKIDAAKHIDKAKHQISFKSFEYFDCISALYNMLAFPTQLSHSKKRYILSRAISNTGLKTEIDSKNVLAEMKRLLNEYINQKEQEFVLLASISIKQDSLPVRIVKFDNLTIKFIQGDIPKKYISRKDIKITPLDMKLHLELSSKNYTNILIYIKAKEPNWAVEHATQCLDIYRGILSLYINYASEFGSEWSPINRIRLGSIYTVHNKNGELHEEGRYWFEPNYMYTEPISLPTSRQRSLKSYFKYMHTAIRKAKYKSNLEDAVVRYVRALDEKDQNVAFLQIWGALESLLSYGEGNNSKLPARGAFLFPESEYHEQILEHLRLYRNESVHAGTRNADVKEYCYQAQFYFRQVLFFYIKESGLFGTIQEANEFLDLPKDMQKLKEKLNSINAQRKLIEKAIKFKGQ